MKFVGKVKRIIYTKNNLIDFEFSMLDKKRKYIRCQYNGNIEFQPNFQYEIVGDLQNGFDNKMILKVTSIKKLIEFKQDEYLQVFNSSLFPYINYNDASKLAKMAENPITFIKNDLENFKNKATFLSKEKISIVIDVVSKYFNSDDLSNIFIENNLNFEILATLKTNFGNDDEIKQILTNDPYKFITAFQKFSFEDIDKIYCFFNEKFTDVRISWVSWKVLTNILFTNGNTYSGISEVCDGVKKIIPEVKEEKFFEHLVYAKNEKILVFKKPKIYTIESWTEEETIANFIKELNLNRPHIEFNIEKFLTKMKEKNNIELNQEQKQVIENFINNPISLVSGGPGTGKTTLIDFIVNAFKEMTKSEKYIVLAPTGRAASRIKEFSQIKTSTIHKFLGYKGGSNFEKNASNKVKTKMIIIDESGMVDQKLFSALFSALDEVTKVVLIGDYNQLPSIGYGDIFRDLIKLETIPKTILKINNRIKTNDINEFALKILNNNLSEDDFVDTENLSFISPDEYDNNSIYDHIMNEYHASYSDNVDEMINNCQLITPMKNGSFGVKEINNHVQNKIIKDKSKKLSVGQNTFYLNDKIIFLENNSIVDFYNGDIGIIKEISNEKSNKNLKIITNNSELKIDGSNLSKLALNYGTTVHKVQGSEFNKILFVVDHTNNHNKWFLNKNILYTAITRSKNKLIIYGNKKDIIQACSRVQKSRLTTLLNKLL